MLLWQTRGIVSSARENQAHEEVPSNFYKRSVFPIQNVTLAWWEKFRELTVVLVKLTLDSLRGISTEIAYIVKFCLVDEPQEINCVNLYYCSIIVPVQFSRSVVSNSLRPHDVQHARPPCPSPTPGVHSNSCPSSRWCHPAISSSVIPFSSWPQSLPASESFPVSQFFASCGQNIGVSASTSVLPRNTQDRFPLGWTGWISLQSKGLSRVFSNTTVQKHQFFGAQLSSQSYSHIPTWLLEKP